MEGDRILVVYTAWVLSRIDSLLLLSLLISFALPALRFVSLNFYGRLKMEGRFVFHNFFVLIQGIISCLAK